MHVTQKLSKKITGLKAYLKIFRFWWFLSVWV